MKKSSILFFGLGILVSSLPVNAQVIMMEQNNRTITVSPGKVDIKDNRPQRSEFIQIPDFEHQGFREDAQGDVLFTVRKGVKFAHCTWKNYTKIITEDYEDPEGFKQLAKKECIDWINQKTAEALEEYNSIINTD